MEQFVHLFDVDRWIAADRPGLQDLVDRGFGIRFLLISTALGTSYSPLNAFGPKRQSSRLHCGLLITNDYILLNQDGHVGGILSGGARAISHSDLCCIQVRGSVTSPSPCCPAIRMDFFPFAAVSSGIGRLGGS